MSQVTPFSAGLRSRCPRCGEGRLFQGFLKFAPACESCALDFSAEDAGDGPAVFIILIVGMIVVPLALISQLVWNVPIWLNLMIWLPVTGGLCLGAMRPFKGVMFALQYQHSAREARLDDDQKG